LERKEYIQSNIPIKSVEEVLLNRMSIEQKIGQLFIFGFDGTQINTSNKEFLKNKNIGGVLLLGKNISNEDQLKSLIEDIQSINTIPLFISIDQEGGVVSRIKWNDTLTKSQASISTKEQAYQLAKSRGDILKSFGINMNLAPVVEYISNPNSFMYDRVYRGSRDDVVEKSVASINGYRDSNVIGVIKHYPGHSDSSPDSHFYLPVVNIEISQWDEYIYPFKKVIDDTTVDALMVGHIKYPNIDSKPSTISEEIVGNRLIKNLNYQGIVISDDMEMGALDDIDSYTEIAKQALLAGNDILIYSKYSEKYPEIQKDVYEYILNEVINGNISEDIINEKVLKILRLKLKYSIFTEDILKQM
jgi:beta-N-acetylhexosaminidase